MCGEEWSAEDEDGSRTRFASFETVALGLEGGDE
jgi:hypothetical protein